jgi:hypothetical protein
MMNRSDVVSLEVRAHNLLKVMFYGLVSMNECYRKDEEKNRHIQTN